ncbi:MAG: YeeE/YedE family protein, partial [Bacteroidales bacterium]|nr:YeeE/YedE family protein [Bacteroidales bacterium]
MGPLIPNEMISAEWNHVFAVLIGLALGVVMESSGLSSSRKIAGSFYGYDFTLIRVFVTAAITSLVGMLYMDYFGWIEMSQIFRVPTFLGATITGGILMGIGFIAAGFCPGTSILAAAIGKIDGMVFILGVFLGILLFGEIFPLISDFYYADNWGNVSIYESFGIEADWFAFIFTVFSVVLFYALTI